MVDHISGLPDEIIHHILSFLLMKDAIKTSVLSKRWRHQWTFNPNLDFPFVSNRYSSHGNYEVSAINRCINVYNPKQLHRLHIDLNLRINPSKQVESWIDFAAKREVEQLNIVVRFHDDDIDFVVPASLFYSKSIRVLRMKSCIFRFPSDFKGFPLLKSLYLNRAKVDDCNSIQSLLSCCPCLESLELLDCKYMKHVRIMNTLSLQRLFVSAAEKIEIFRAPNLQYFRCNSNELRALLLKHASSLVTVDVSSVSFARGTWPAQVIREWNRFVVDVSHVKILSVNPSFVQLVCAESYLKKKQRVVFKNLKRLNFDGRINDNFTLHALFDFFQDCPSLENVKIDVRFPWPLQDDNWISEFIERERKQGILQHKLTCYLLYNLKNVRLNGFSGKAEEVMLVNVLFDKAAVLEKFFLSSCVTNSELLHMELASLPKRSPSARITVENGLRFKNI